MSSLNRVIVIALVLSLAGCYHATVDTGLAPSTVTIEEAWASGWVFGLVPPSTIYTEDKCADGVARVETKLSFLNQLVGLLTLGIYTPMEIIVTCASGGSALNASPEPDIVLDDNATSNEVSQAFMRAAEIAVEEGRPVFVAY